MTGMTDKALFIEEIVLDSVKQLLSGRVNELLGETEYPIPPIEFGQSGFTGLSPEFRPCRNSTMPSIALSTCERSEKERIVRLDAYTLSITFTVPEYPSDQRSVRPRSVGERNCYAYAASVVTALGEDPTLGGVVNRAVLTGKKYSPPKCAGTGADWSITLTLHVTTEEVGL